MSENQTRFNTALNLMGKDSYNKYGSYSHFAGYEQGLLVQMLELLPKSEQQKFIEQLEQSNGNTLIKVKNCLTGGEVEIRRCDKGTINDPSMEAYHSF